METAMARLSTSERSRLTALALDKWRRRAISEALYSPLLKWRYGSGIADHLLIVPRDLRPADPSFWHELEIGQFGLAGSIAALDDKSPFVIKPPSKGWEKALHGFGWLRHLESAENIDAQLEARRLVHDWIERNGAESSVAWTPDVVARRLISWITYAPFLLQDADAKSYDTIFASLGLQVVRLSATWRDAPPGMPRLISLLAIALAELALATFHRRHTSGERLLCDELDKQILPDGGHISRNPAILVDVLLDLLPLSQCFKARETPQPFGLSNAIERALSMLRFMRMGDGALSRFNGSGASSPAGLATVLAYDDISSGKHLFEAPSSNYARLEAAETVVIADVGCPPALEYASQCHAGALSFEMSFGRNLVFINSGCPGHSQPQWRAASRATSAHNTLRLGEKSSSKLVRHKLFEDLVGAMPIRYPTIASHTITTSDDGSTNLVAHHDGYVHRFCLVHHRELNLSEDGTKLEGIDRIRGQETVVRLREDLPFTIHFHLHPDVTATPTRDDNAANLTLANGTVFEFTADGAVLNIEDSAFYADTSGATRTRQIVLRGATFGESEIRWSCKKV